MTPDYIVDPFEKILNEPFDGSYPLMVAGFLFDDTVGPYVALVRKKRPAWQAGKLNGIGGKVEPQETPLEAMRREFKEETGAIVNDWRPFCLLQGKTGWKVVMFTSNQANVHIQTMEDEFIGWFDYIRLLKTLNQGNQCDVISNLRWLIPMALDKDNVMAIVNDPT